MKKKLRIGSLKQNLLVLIRKRVYFSKTFDIWVEQYLVIFNDNLAIFDNRNAHTGARKLSPKRYRKFCHLSPSGSRAFEFSF